MDQYSLWQYFLQVYTHHYVDFAGRARRREYWGFMLFYGLIWLLLLGVGIWLAFDKSMFEPGGTNGIIIFFSFLIALIPASIYSMLSILPAYGVLARRLHDTNKPTWLIFVPLILAVAQGLTTAIACTGYNLPNGGDILSQILLGISGILNLNVIVWSIYILICTCKDGTPGDNAYGPDPKGRSTSQTQSTPQP